MSSSTLKNIAMLLIWMDETLHLYASILSCSLPHGHVIMWRNWLFSFSWFPPTVTTIYDKVGRLSCPHLFTWRHEKWTITVCGPYAVTILNRPPKFERYITKVVVEDITIILGSVIDTIGRVHVITKRESTITLDSHNFTSQPLFLNLKQFL